MASWKKAFALVLLSAVPMGVYSNCLGPETWSGTVDGSWNNVLNWSPNCVPGTLVTDTDSATFGSTVGASSAISLDTVAITPGLNQLIFNNSSTSFTISGNSSHFLQFNGASPSIGVTGNHSIVAPIKLNGTPLTVTINPSSSLTYQGELDDLGTSSMNLTGAGQFINNMGSIELEGNFSATGGSLTNQNSANVTGSIGSLISAENFTFTNETVLNNNAIDSVNAGGTGVKLEADSTFTINGGTFTNSNSGHPIGNTSMGSMVSADNLIINNGQFINANSGETTGSHDRGALVQVTNNLTMNGGSLSNSNSGNITGSFDVGSMIDVGNNFTISGGASVTNTNTGSVTGSSAEGSIIRAGNQINISNGSFVNSAIVQAKSVMIGSAGVLSGTGIYQDAAGGATTQVINGGRMVLGDASFNGNAGTINIQGSYQQQSSGTLVAHLGSSSSLLQVTGTPGTATLAGTLEADFIAGSVNLANPFTVLHAANGISGTFSKVTTPGNPNVLGQAQYTNDSVILRFAPTIPSIISGGGSGFSTAAVFPGIVTPQIVFAGASNFFNTTSMHMVELARRIYPEEVELEGTGKSAASRGKKIAKAGHSSEFLAANTSGADELLGFVRNPVLADDTTQKQEQLKRKLLAEAKPDYPAKFYIGPQGQLGEALDVNFWSAGAIAGFDYAFKKAGVGLGAITSYTRSGGKGFFIDEISANLYATYKPKSQKHLTINGILGGAWDWYDFNSKTGFSNHPKIAKGKTHGPQFKSLLGLQYTFRHDQFCSIPKNLEISPLISAQYNRAFVSKYRQHDAGLFNMALSSAEAKDFRTTLGAHVFYSWEWENFSVGTDYYVAWQREFLLKDGSMTARPIAISGPPTTIVIPGIGRNIGQAAFDLMLTWYHVYGLEANYSYEWNSKYHYQNLYIAFNYHF